MRCGLEFRSRPRVAHAPRRSRSFCSTCHSLGSPFCPLRRYAAGTIVMPKIRTKRTKNPPEGFEEIEAVCLNSPSGQLVSSSAMPSIRSSMTTQKRCEMRRTSLTRANASQSRSGLSCGYPTLVHGISMSCITSARPSPRSFTTGS